MKNQRSSLIPYPIPHSPANRDGGSVLVELLILVPVLYIIFTGLVDLGRLYGQATRASQTAYLTINLGAETDSQIAAAKMQDLSFKLINLQNKDLTNPQFGNVTFDLAQSQVSGKFSGKLKSFYSPAGVDLNVDYTGPIIAMSNQDTSEYRNFLNPGRRYNCTGRVCTPGIDCPLIC